MQTYMNVQHALTLLTGENALTSKQEVSQWR